MHLEAKPQILHTLNTHMPQIYINLEEERLKKENESLKAELAQLKDAIKRCQGTFILDGNDMYDWGWMPMSEVNQECRKRWGYALSEYPNPPEVTATILTGGFIDGKHVPNS